MTNVMEEVAVLEQEEGWGLLFQQIKLTSAEYDLPCSAARMLENRSKNRYRDVSPYDHCRVQLIDGSNNYINSSLVTVEKADRRYILCQGPLPTTSGQMWQMIWEQKSKSVIMLNKIMEKGIRKCDQYWPTNYQKPLVFKDVGYSVSLISEKDKQNFVIRELKLTKLVDGNEVARNIFQFHYTAWPDFGVPESPTAFLDFLACVREHEVLENKYGPAVIHCSAGIGRSGTFALVDTCLVFLEKGIDFDIKETLLEMRKYRMGLIQTAHQLRFSFFAIAECERILQNREDDDSDESEELEYTEMNADEFRASNGDYIRIDKELLSQKNMENEGEKDMTDRGELNGSIENKEVKHASNSMQPSDGVSIPAKTSTFEMTENSVKTSDIKIHTDSPTTTSSLHSHDHNAAELNNLRQRAAGDKLDSTRKEIEDINHLTTEQELGWSWKLGIAGGVTAIACGLVIRYWFNG